ncbi:hypothetical protein B0H13DRAFT_1972764 [Mycena leptocephala]|nr:hypothetical protein B0H13DRAFT_1972764 [Mycena leptocephala]
MNLCASAIFTRPEIAILFSQTMCCEIPQHAWLGGVVRRGVLRARRNLLRGVFFRVGCESVRRRVSACPIRIFILSWDGLYYLGAVGCGRGGGECAGVRCSLLRTWSSSCGLLARQAVCAENVLGQRRACVPGSVMVAGACVRAEHAQGGFHTYAEDARGGYVVLVY